MKVVGLMFYMQNFIEGFLLQASLILALGAQNLFILESGLKRQRHLWVALICSLCDGILIFIGVAGAASIFVRVPALKVIFGLLGIVFLFYYGTKNLFESFRPEILITPSLVRSLSMRTIVGLSLGFSLLNPHVYLDTIVLVGGYSSKFLKLGDRLLFGLGAAFFSVIWFFGLAMGASFLSHLLQRSPAIRIIALFSGIILIGLSLKLGVDVWGWLGSSAS